MFVMTCAATEITVFKCRDHMQFIEEARLCVLKCVRKIEDGGPCFRLSSGKLSPYYIDLRPVLYGDVDCLEKICRAILELVRSRGYTFDVIACKALGAVSLAVTLSLLSRKPMVILRERVKDYGTGGRAVGPIEKLRGASVLIVDDVATTGNTLLEVLNFVKENGASRCLAVVVVDREEGARENLKRSGCELLSLFTRRDLGITDDWLEKTSTMCREVS